VEGRPEVLETPGGPSSRRVGPSDRGPRLSRPDPPKLGASGGSSQGLDLDLGLSPGSARDRPRKASGRIPTRRGFPPTSTPFGEAEARSIRLDPTRRGSLLTEEDFTSQSGPSPARDPMRPRARTRPEPGSNRGERVGRLETLECRASAFGVGGETGKVFSHASSAYGGAGLAWEAALPLKEWASPRRRPRVADRVSDLSEARIEPGGRIGRLETLGRASAFGVGGETGKVFRRLFRLWRSGPRLGGGPTAYGEAARVVDRVSDLSEARIEPGRG